MPCPDLPRSDPRLAAAVGRAVDATLDPGLLKHMLKVEANAAPQRAAPRHPAPQAAQARPVKTNPLPNAPGAAGSARKPRALKAIQLTAARLLLQGRSVTEVARELEVHRYTISRWQSDPRFQAELRRQLERDALRHAAQHGATV